MKKIIISLIIATGSLLVLMGAGTSIGRKMNISGEGVKIIFYQQGKKTVLDPQSPHFKELQKKCEEFLSSATNVLRDFISKDKVSIIKKNESAIEVVYRKPKEINVHSFNKKIKADHLLIPLTGKKYVNIEKGLNVRIFFYGPGYGPDYIGPHWIPKDVNEIIKLLQLMGVTLKPMTKQ